MDAEDLDRLTSCRICGAAVANGSKHREWHAEKGEVEPKKEPGQVWGF